MIDDLNLVFIIFSLKNDLLQCTCTHERININVYAMYYRLLNAAIWKLFLYYNFMTRLACRKHIVSIMKSRKIFLYIGVTYCTLSSIIYIR